jgi:hypothetical protein
VNRIAERANAFMSWLQSKDSCGTEAAVGKVGSGSGVLPATRSESQQNCAGLGAEWGIPPAGIQFGRCGESAGSEQKKAGTASSDAGLKAPPLNNEQRPTQASGGVHTQGQIPSPSASVTSLSSDTGDRPLTGALGSGKSAPPAGIQKLNQREFDAFFDRLIAQTDEMIARNKARQEQV